jgi:hypothetical protein
MRMMLSIHVDVIKGGEALKSGATEKAIAGFNEKFKPEASYFTEVNGERSGFFVVDMKGSDQMPAICEVFFDLGHRVHLVPCMTPDDLQKGVAAAGLS